MNDINIIDQTSVVHLVTDHGIFDIINEDNHIHVLHEGIQGASSESPSITAAASIPGERVVTLNGSGGLVLASPGLSIPLGMSVNSGNIGEPVLVKTSGKFYSAALSLTPGSLVFLAASGTLTQTPPTSGYSQVIGFATDADTLILNIQSPIQLS